METFIEAYGWYGAVAILTAYFLNSFQMIKVGPLYQSLNLTGAIGIVLVSIYNGAYPPAGLNAVWAMIALVALMRGAKTVSEENQQTAAE